MNCRAVSLIVTASVLVAVSAQADEGATLDRFQLERFELWNNCQPIEIVITNRTAGAAELGLTNEAMRARVHQRLQAEDLYDADSRTSAVLVRAAVGSRAFIVVIRYLKEMSDSATGLTHIASVWWFDCIATHGGDVDRVLTCVARVTDNFIHE